MHKRSTYILVLALCVGSTVIWTAMRAINATAHAPSSSERWSPQSAALYLDVREVWWQKWPPAQMDHETVCISCHTVVPYALVRPGLRNMLGRGEITGPEQTMLASIK